jgi:hypothetical protein
MNLVAALSADRELLGREEDTNRVNERQVRQWEERRKVEEDVGVAWSVGSMSDWPKQIALLQIQLPYAQYNKLRKKWDRAKIQKRDAVVALREIEAKHEPFVAMRKQLKDKAKDLKLGLKDYHGNRNQLLGREARMDKDMAAMRKSAEKINEELDGITELERSRKGNMKKHQTKIAELEAQLEGVEELPNPNAFNTEQSRVQNEIRSLERARGDITAEEEPINQHRQQLSGRIYQAEDIMRKLNDEAFRGEESLKATEIGTWTLWQEAKKGNSEAKVFPPIRLCCSPRRPEFAVLVEAVISQQRAKAILCLSRADYDRLASFQLRFGPNERRNKTIELATITPQMASLDPEKVDHPMTREEVRLQPAG